MHNLYTLFFPIFFFCYAALEKFKELGLSADETIDTFLQSPHGVRFFPQQGVLVLIQDVKNRDDKGLCLHGAFIEP